MLDTLSKLPSRLDTLLHVNLHKLQTGPALTPVAELRLKRSKLLKTRPSHSPWLKRLKQYHSRLHCLNITDSCWMCFVQRRCCTSANDMLAKLSLSETLTGNSNTCLLISCPTQKWIVQAADSLVCD